MNLSLRNRLLLCFGLIVSLTAFGVTFLTEEVIIRRVERDLDDTLQKRVNLVAAIVSSDITTDEASYYEVISDLSEQEFYFMPLSLRLVSPGGKTIIGFGQLSESVMQKLDYQWQLPDINSGRLDNVSVEGASPLRVYSISVSDPHTKQTLAFIQAAESTSSLEDVRRQLWQNAAIVGLAGSLLSIIVVMLLIRQGFRPLQSILQTIDSIDYNHLTTRIQKETRPAEFEQLAQSLTAMWQRLDTAVSDREKFFRSMSHDLRTPLSTLQGHIELLRRQPSLTEEAKSSIQHMHNETRRLIRLVNNLLLNVQLATKPTLTNEEINLSELLDEIVGDVWILAEGLQLNITTKNDIKVYGDRDLLKQMLLNIVDNAIKFTPKGRSISLALTSDGEWAIVEISDTGRGISSEDLPHVTEAFYMSGASRKPVAGGVGLGLSIAKQITELHGGQLEIRSKERVGTSVRIRLPQRILIILPEH